MHADLAKVSRRYGDSQRGHTTKKLRYAAEFFASLFAGKREMKSRKQFLPVLDRLQDALGDLNDIAVHGKRIAAMGIGRHRSRVNSTCDGFVRYRSGAHP
jgi:CHAD domain-containing protein